MSNGLPRLKSIKATKIFVKNCVFVCFLFGQSKIHWLFFVLFSQEMRYEVMVMLFLLVFFCFALMINNSPFSFTNDGTLPQMKINLKISKHGKVKSEDGETSVGTSAADRHCTRKDHVVYIKTHKTGSTTAAGLFWRYVSNIAFADLRPIFVSFSCNFRKKIIPNDKLATPITGVGAPSLRNPESATALVFTHVN